MTRYASHVSRRETPQSESADSRQVENSAGGYAFTLDKWGRLTRFLILGAEGGTYYIGERQLTKENAACIQECLDEDGKRTVAEIVEISESGRAPKNEPAIFALALAASHNDTETRREALANLSKVCRIGTHLFQFVASVQELRGGGRALRRAVAAWYTNRPAHNLGYQVVKYRQRKIGKNAWSHRDVLRKFARGYLKDAAGSSEAVIRYAVHGVEGMGPREANGRSYPAVAELPGIVQGFEALQKAESVKEAAKLISEHRLTHEMVPTQFKNDVGVWDALLEHMPMGAMVRNLAKMTAVGLLKPFSDASKFVVAKLADEEQIRRSRMHPLGFLSAVRLYGSGHGMRGNLTWEPVPQITDGVEGAYYLAFSNIEPTGKNILLALDASGSMTWNNIAGVPGITPRAGSAAMAMCTARSEENYHFMAFTRSRLWNANDPGISPLNITRSDRLDAVIQKIESVTPGGTDCSLPMLWALENKVNVDVFQVYTDNETWAGKIHPHQALQEYRRKINPDARLIVVGMESNGFTIADPSDAGMLDVVGFDTAAPAVMADFARGNL